MGEIRLVSNSGMDTRTVNVYIGAPALAGVTDKPGLIIMMQELNGTTELGTSVSKVFSERFSQLECFVSENGRFPKKDERYLEFGLGAWFSALKRRVREGTLTKEYESRLTKLGFVNRTPLEQFEEWLALTIKFKETHGRWPRHEEMFDGRGVGHWLSTQRHKAKALDYEGWKKDKLTSAGIDIDPNASAFQRKLDALRKFIQTHGRKPRISDCQDGIEVGKWVISRRHAIKNGEMPEDQKSALISLGILEPEPRAKAAPKNTLSKEERRQIYNSISERQFERRIASVLQFKSINGRLPDLKETLNGRPIGRWLRQNVLFALKEKDSHKYKALCEIGAIQSYEASVESDTEWEGHLSEVEKFKAQHGRLPQSNESLCGTRSLGKWMQWERSRYKKGDMPERRHAKFLEAGLVESPIDQQWQKMYEDYLRFLTESGRHPNSHETGALGSWILRQRKLYRTGELQKKHPARVELLSNIDFPWGAGSPDWEEKWNFTYDQILQFLKLNERVPSSRAKANEGPLALWLKAQKGLLRKGAILPERKAKIEALYDLASKYCPGTSASPLARPSEEKHLRMLSMVDQFYEKHGRLPGNREEFEGINIGFWMAHQRKRWRDGSLPEETKKKLECYGIAEDPLLRPFKQNIELAKSFFKENNRWPRQPDKYDGRHIGTWLNFQRRLIQKLGENSERARLFSEAGIPLFPEKAPRVPKAPKARSSSGEARSLERAKVDEDFDRIKSYQDWQVHVLRGFLDVNLRLPRAGEKHQGHAVGYWVQCWRRQARRSEIDPFIAERLRSIGVGILEGCSPCEYSIWTSPAPRQKGAWNSTPAARERKARAVELRQKGLSYGAIARELGRTATEVGVVLRQEGLGGNRATKILRHDGSFVSKAQKRAVSPQVVLELREGKNYTYAMIAKELDISMDQVREAIVQAGGHTARFYRKGKYWIDESRVVELYTSGKTRNEIADELGATSTRVAKILESKGIKIKRYVSVDSQKVKELFLSGMNASQIAVQVNSSRNTVGRCLRDMGFTPYRPKVVSDEVVSLHRKGMSLTEISEQINANSSQVFRALKKALGKAYTSSALTAADHDEIKRLKTNGLTDRAISLSLNLPLQTVRSSLRHQGFSVRTPPPPRAEGVLALEDQGVSRAEIARQLRCTLAQVQKVIKENNRVKPHRKWTAFELRELLDLHEKGETIGALATKYSVARATIERRIDEAIVIRNAFTQHAPTGDERELERI